MTDTTPTYDPQAPENHDCWHDDAHIAQCHICRHLVLREDLGALPTWAGKEFKMVNLEITEIPMLACMSCNAKLRRAYLHAVENAQPLDTVDHVRNELYVALKTACRALALYVETPDIASTHGALNVIHQASVKAMGQAQAIATRTQVKPMRGWISGMWVEISKEHKITMTPRCPIHEQQRLAEVRESADRLDA